MKILGWLLVGGGSLFIIGYIAFIYVTTFLTEPQVPLVWRVVPTAIIIGSLLLLASVLYDRITGRDELSEEES